MAIYILYIYYIKLKSRLSVRPSAFFPRQAVNSAISAALLAGTAYYVQGVK